MKDSRYLILVLIVTVFVECRCYAQRRFHIENCKDVELLIGEKYVKNFNLPCEIDEKTNIKLNSGGWIKIKEFSEKIDFDKFKEVSQANINYNPTLPCYILSLRQYRDLNKKRKQSDGFILMPQGGASSEKRNYSFVHEEEVNCNYVEDRVALIIGNANYDNWDYLPTIGSAIAVSEKLRKIGFNTIVKFDAKKDTINSVMDYLCSYKGTKKKIIKLFYFIGHGMRINNCDYIIPTDAEKNDSLNSIKIRDFSYRIDSLTGGKEDYNILFVDACRDGGSMYESDGGYYFENNRTLIIPSTTNGEYAYVSLNNKPFFSNAFIKNIDNQNFKIGKLVNEIFNDVKNSTNQQQRIATIPSVSDIEKKSLNKEKFTWWVGVGIKGQIPFRSELPMSLSPNITFCGTNFYLWRYKTQFEIELGWNGIDKKTLPVYLYDKDKILEYASRFRNTWNVSCRYGPSFDFCRKWSISSMVGISYHYLHGSHVNEMTVGPVSTYCCNLAFDCELSYKFYKNYKLNIILGTNICRINNENYDRLKDITFMKDWYVPFNNVSVGVALSRRL